MTLPSLDVVEEKKGTTSQSQFARSITRANAPAGVLQPPTYPVGATQFNSQRPISHRAITAPRMNAAKIQSSEARQDLIGQCQSERSRGDVRPAKPIPGAQA